MLTSIRSALVIIGALINRSPVMLLSPSRIVAMRHALVVRHSARIPGSYLAASFDELLQMMLA